MVETDHREPVLASPEWVTNHQRYEEVRTLTMMISCSSRGIAGRVTAQTINIWSSIVACATQGEGGEGEERPVPN